MPVAGVGVAEVVGLVSDGTGVVVGRVPDLTQCQRAEAAGQSDIGQASARLAGVFGGDLVLEAVDCGQSLGRFGGALDAPARAAVEELGVFSAACLHAAAQRPVPGRLGEDN